MPTQIIELIVDRSGSMRGKESDTVGGINACITELKKTLGENDIINVSLKLFDHDQTKLWDNVNITDISEFLQNDFVPRGQTALLDAMGDSITHYKKMKEDMPNCFDTCILYVATDGLENCSSKYNQNTVKKLIQDAERDCNITVMYLGANQDAIFEAARFGISGDRAINYHETSQTVEAVYRAIGSSAARRRSGMNVGFIESERIASQSTPTNNNAPQFVRNNRLSQSSVPVQSPPAPPIPSRSQTISSFPPPPPPPIIIEEWKQHLFLDAAKEHKWDTVKGLLGETPGLVNVVGGSANRWTALHQASASGNKEMVSYLLSIGADKTIVNRDGYTARQVIAPITPGFSEIYTLLS